MGKHFAGARIRTLRRTRNLTQQEMARRLNLSTSYLNQLENDQRPLTVTVLMSLSRHFDVDPAFFSPDHDARTVGELREAFPTVPDTQLADLVARYPELVAEVLQLADRAPSRADDSASSATSSTRRTTTSTNSTRSGRNWPAGSATPSSGSRAWRPPWTATSAWSSDSAGSATGRGACTTLRPGNSTCAPG